MHWNKRTKRARKSIPDSLKIINAVCDDERLKYPDIGEAQNGTCTENMTKSRGAQQCTQAHTTKEVGRGQLRANILLLDSEFADRDRNDVANDHYDGDRRCPIGGSSGNSQ